MFLVPFPGNQRRAHFALACDIEFSEARCGWRGRAKRLGGLGACKAGSMLPLLAEEEEAFERPKALIG